MAAGGSKSVIYAALAGNLAIAVTKFAAALWTGSSAMLSEAIHSTVDTSNQGLLLYGMRRAARPADATHPFGHGMEMFFWAFVVALLIFGLGGAVSIYQGLHKIAKPEPIEDAWVNFAVLGASILFEGLAFRAAWREDPGVFAVLLEDAAAMTGLVIALIGVGLAQALDQPILDGVASVAIGVVLILTAMFLARETLSLMTGESASRRTVEQARAVFVADPRIERVDEILGMHLGPDSILLAVTVDFRDELNGREIETAARELSETVRREQPEIKRVFLQPIHRKMPPTTTRPHDGAPVSA
jgi:cation diffusion facilitator family transporter